MKQFFPKLILYKKTSYKKSHIFYDQSKQSDLTHELQESLGVSYQSSGVSNNSRFLIPERDSLSSQEMIASKLNLV